MLEVKWVTFDGFAADDETDAAVRYKFGQVPVLTLDQLEAWLEEERTPRGEEHRVVIDDMLAQVQAWRTQGDTR